MVTTILNKDTGVILYSTDGEFELNKNEVIAPFAPTELLIKGSFDFKNKVYFETATEEEIESYKIQFKIEE
jgi:hypothetical protein